MLKKLLGVFFGMAFFGMASSAQATLLNNNFTIFGDGLYGTIDGMFSGETGKGGILENGEVVTLMATYTPDAGSPYSAYTLEIPDHFLDSFEYDPALDLLKMEFGFGGAGADGIDYISDGSSLFKFAGVNSPLSTGYSHTVTPKIPVPEPSTLLLFGAGLIGLVGIGRRRRKQAESA